MSGSFASGRGTLPSPIKFAVVGSRHGRYGRSFGSRDAVLDFVEALTRGPSRGWEQDDIRIVLDGGTQIGALAAYFRAADLLDPQVRRHLLEAAR